VKRTLLWAGIALAVAGCKKADPAPVYMKVAVERRDIVVTASAAGAIQPILTVSVKSQASGAVTEMHVQSGDFVQVVGIFWIVIFKEKGKTFFPVATLAAGSQSVPQTIRIALTLLDIGISRLDGKHSLLDSFCVTPRAVRRRE